jgi:flagellar motor switch protein FliN/FliY
MANPSDSQACSFFASNFVQLLTRALSMARNSEWLVRLAEPPSATVPVLQSPVYYCLRFGKRLKGACYIALSAADAAHLATGEPPSAQGEEGQDAPLPEAKSAALLELMSAVSTAIPQVLLATHGAVTTTAEPAETLDPAAVYTIELQVKPPTGPAAVLLLYFDMALAKSLTASALNGAGSEKGPSQANLGLVMDVELSCTLRFGQRQLPLREILDLASGSVIELDRQVDEPVELILDGRVIARGEAVIIDGNYGLRVTQVVNAIAF